MPFAGEGWVLVFACRGVAVCVLVTLLMSDFCHIIQEEAAWEQVSRGSAALREARAELAEARRQWHSLQVEIETLHALVRKHTLSLTVSPLPNVACFNSLTTNCM